MPWLLIALGLVAVACCFVLLLRPIQRTSRTVVASTSARSKYHAPVVRRQVSEERAPVSDTLLVALITSGAVLIALGAFYWRLEKLGWRDVTVGLTPFSRDEEARIAQELTEALSEKMQTELRTRLAEPGASEQLEPIVEEIARLVPRAVSAVLTLRERAAGEKLEQLSSAGKVDIARLPPGWSSRVIKAESLGDDTYKRLAREAVDDVLGAEDD